MTHRRRFIKRIFRRQITVAVPLFDELFNNFEDYRHQYECIGYDLVMGQGSMFARESGLEEQFNEVAM